MESNAHQMEPSRAAVSQVAALWKVLVEPKATFEALRERSPWVLPFVIGLVLVFAFTYFSWPLLMDAQLEQIRLHEGMPEAAKQAAMERIAQIRDQPVMWQVTLGPIVGAVFALIAAAVWLLVGNVVLGGNAHFRNIWSMFNYAGMVGIVSLALKWAMMTMKGSADVHTSLALLAPNLPTSSFTYRALNGVDVFSIWFFIVIGLGLAAVCKVGTPKAMTAVFAVWVVWVLGFRAGLGSLAGGLLGM